LTEEQAFETVRFSFGMFNQEEEIRNGISILKNIVKG
jgi:cysteine sulfinate desulfinase/cysteine desulfurase-like protein